METLVLFSQNGTKLTVDQLQSLTEGAKIEAVNENCFLIKWGQVTLRMTYRSDQQLQTEVTNFTTFVRDCAGDLVSEIQDMIDAIDATELVILCELENGFDSSNKAKGYIISLAATLEQCMMYYDGMVLSPFGEVWFGPENGQPLADLSKLKVTKISLHSLPEMTENQRSRFERVKLLLDKYSVPLLMKRAWVGDETTEKLRRPQEVARRVLALHAVVCIARGRPREETMQELEEAQAIDALTPEEQQFLDDNDVSDAQRQSVIWKLEALWLLMWSLRHIDVFAWPNSMCDVEGLHELIFEKAKDPIAFVDQASIRSKRSILDATQLIIQLHAVIRAAYIAEETIPANFDWGAPSEMMDVRSCPNVGVVAERHLALNWLRKFGDDDWDKVDTPTVPAAILYEE